MTSEPDAAFVWVWPPGATEPVVCGRLDHAGGLFSFTYGRSYLARADAVPLYLPEFPLAPGTQQPPAGLDLAGCIDDAAPDAWGRRVIEARRPDAPEDASLLTLLLESGSDRTGALDFQTSATDYVPRGGPAPLEDLLRAAEHIEAGEPLAPALDVALLHGSSVGGARPKATLHDRERSLIAKFSSTTDTFPVVKAEAVAMDLARRCGLEVARTELTTCLGKDVLLVDRFDRGPAPGTRRMMVSALTILGLPEHAARHATYHELADTIRQRFAAPDATLRELFRRIVFNIAVGNTDDHARNHAAFWDGTQLTLTPAYDLCPQTRTGGHATQAMAIGSDGSRWSQFSTTVKSAPTYHLDEGEAQEVVDHVVDTIRDQWDDAADAARLTTVERRALWQRQILNPFAFETTTADG